MNALFDALLRRVVRVGRLTVRYPDGCTATYGAGGGPSAGLRLRDAATVRRIMVNPSLRFGEAYMDGGIEPEDGSTIYDILDVITGNLAAGISHPLLRAHDWLSDHLRLLQQINPAARARRNVAHHYDLNGRLYALFLDRDRQYSCAYFARGDETIEEAQAAKKRHIAAKLRLDRPGLRVLDIGCGWGGLALTLAREHGAIVTGITLSQEQHAEAQARAAAGNLSDRVRFELVDYRAVSGRFDRIVSVGMFEHVGLAQFRRFFGVVHDRLEPDGVALLHTIGRLKGPGSTNPWLRKYIFPGGYSPALSEVAPVIERSGLYVTDVEVLRLHYALTIRAWRRRVAANRDAIAALYDERFCRMFEFYLAGCELAFRHDGHCNLQIQLARRIDTVPITRDYMVDAERAQPLRVPRSVST